MNIAHINIRSLYPSFNELKDVVGDENFMILGVTETWLSPEIGNDVLGIDGYGLVRNDREGRGGGVAIYYKTNLNIKIHTLEQKQALEQLWITFKIKQETYGLGVVYRAPSQNVSEALNILESTISDILPEVDNIIITGDLNINMFNLAANSTMQLMSFMDTFKLTQVINEPTRITNYSSTLIDVMLINSNKLVLKQGCRDMHDLTDHRLIFCQLNVKITKCNTKFYTFRNFKNFNYNSFLADLFLVHWDLIYQIENVNDKIKYLNENIIKLFDIHAPITTIKVSKPKAPWLTDVIKIMIKTRNKLLADFKKYKTDDLWNQYKQMRNYVTNAVRQEKKAYLEFSHNRGIRETWKALDTLNINSHKHPSLPDSFNNMNEINEYFVQVSTNAKSACKDLVAYFKNNKFKTTHEEFKFMQVNAVKIEKIINSIKSNAKGADGITIDMIKYCIPYILNHITHIVNASLDQSEFPEIFKNALVIPVPKINDPNSFSDLRPISILSAFSKIIERVMHEQINVFLNENNILPLQQSGFRKGHSTVSALLEVTDDIIRSVDERRTTALVLLDYSKAFDTLDHDLLCAKLHYYGFHNSAVNLICNYLTNRSQSVILSNNVSESLPVTSGVPQGSILGPLLFIVYAADIARQLNFCNYHQYADDTQVYLNFSKSEALQAITNINNDLESLHAYSIRSSLMLNPSKSTVIYFGPDSDWTAANFNIIINGEILPTTGVAKSLGLVLDKQLRFREHTNKLVQKCYLALRNLFRNRFLLNKDIRKKLSESLVLSILNYADIIYGPCLDTRTAGRIQKIQNNCVRLVFNLTRRDHVTCKLNELGWLNMHNRRQLHYSCFLHKMFTTNHPEYLIKKLNQRSTSHNINIRHSHHFTIPKHRTTFFKRSFCYSATKIYNSIPLQIKSYSPLSFKASLRKNLFIKQLES